MAAKKQDERPDDSMEPKNPVPSISQTEESGSHPDTVNTQVPSQKVEDNLSDVRYSTPVVELKGVQNAASSELADQVSQLLSILSAENLSNLINAAVEKKFGNSGNFNAGDVEALAQEGTFSQPTKRAKNDPVKKVFRNTLHPNIKIQELDMSQPNPSASPILGSWIQFTNGRFFAMTDNQVTQLDAMSSKDATDRNGNSIGGNRDIQEDSGKVTLDIDTLRARGFSESDIQNLRK